MIQRIQSLWLFMAGMALTAMFFMPLGTFLLPRGMYACSVWGTTISGNLPALSWPCWPMGVCALISVLLSLGAIFAYRNRSLQVRLTRYASAVKGLLLLMAVGLFLAVPHSTGALVSYGVALPLPLIGIVLDLLAVRGIRKDEELVRSLDRIR
jgi:hypothetical protein